MIEVTTAEPAVPVVAAVAVWKATAAAPDVPAVPDVSAVPVVAAVAVLYAAALELRCGCVVVLRRGPAGDRSFAQHQRKGRRGVRSQPEDASRQLTRRTAETPTTAFLRASFRFGGATTKRGV